MKSYWIDSIKNKEEYFKLNSDLNVDVCIIGGGLVGISTAYKLRKEKLKTIVLEKGNIGKSTSGNSTAKITSQHGLIYKYLVDSKGKDFAQNYYKANEEAIENINNIIKEENIECDFEYQPAYVFTQKVQDVEKIKDEVKTIKDFRGEAEFIEGSDFEILKSKSVDTVDNNNKKLNITVDNSLNITSANESNIIKEKLKNIIPLKPVAGIKFEKQAQFNPYKYLISLANICNSAGVNIFEHTKVIDVKLNDGTYEILAESGYIVKAKQIVIATKYPIINIPGFYFMKMYQSTSYVIGWETDKKLFNGMYISSEKPIISLRMAKHKNKNLLIVAGFDNKTGENIDLCDSYKYLEEIAKSIYPKGNFKYCWNTEDCITLDKIPYIGKFSELWDNAYVATGFNKWGMTTSNIASGIISDMVLGRKNKYEEIFKSTRLEPIKNIKEVTNMIKESIDGLIIKKIKIPDEAINQIQEGEGKIVEVNGDKVGVYKESNNKIYSINPVCKHLGCELTWNNLDKTWDCPCHGSRYDYKGKLIYGPSVKNLE